MLCKYLISNLILLLITLQSFAQICETEFDFNQWTKQGTPDADWIVESSNNVICNSYVFPATFFVNQQNMVNVLIKGTISVETGADDDFLGIVFGYHKPTQIANDNEYNFFLFDWKSKSGLANGYGATEGFRLSKYEGFISENNQNRYFWGALETSGIRKILKSKYGETLGWEPNTKYEIDILYATNLISIKIDGDLIFESEGCFSSGKVGFYCMSQTLTRFENFTYQYAANFTNYPKTICKGEEMKFYPYDPECTTLPDFIKSMHWNFGDGTSSEDIITSHTYEESGEYEVELWVYKTDDCVDTIIKNITVKADPIVDLGDDISLPICSSYELDAENQGASYLWSTDETTQTITLENIDQDTTIWVEVEVKGCKSNDIINIKTQEEQKDLYFPNAFTPNNDGKNDIFSPIGDLEYVIVFNLQIFNKWGQKIFETIDPTEGWDGKCNGKLSPLGTYIYKCNYTIGSLCVENNSQSKQGSITLLN
jgi:gliding motility-associated-like protein